MVRGRKFKMREGTKELESFPDILTVMELKELLGIGREQAYELVKSEDFPTKRIGRRIIIYKPNLIKWLEKTMHLENKMLIENGKYLALMA